jgi:phage tail-like protein
MPVTPAAQNELVDAGYFDLNLKGLETISFMQISGLTHTVPIGGGAVASKDGSVEDARVIGPPAPMTLTMNYTLASEMTLWEWLETSILDGSAKTAAKEGTLELKSLDLGAPQMTWNLQDVYLESIQVGDMGAGSPNYLTATVSMKVGACKPM